MGISFQQSASTVYFRKVRCWIQVSPVAVNTGLGAAGVVSPKGCKQGGGGGMAAERGGRVVSRQRVHERRLRRCALSPWRLTPRSPPPCTPCAPQEAGRLGTTVQALVNPSDEALFNLRTAMSNQSELQVLEVLAESDEALPLLADRLRRQRGGASAAAATAAQRRAAAAAAVNGVKSEDGREQQQQQQQQGAPPQAQHPQHTHQSAAAPSADALLRQATGLPGGSGQLGWQQAPQVTLQSLELLQAALTQAIQLTTSSSALQATAAVLAAQQQPALPHAAFPPAFMPPMAHPQLQPQQLQALAMQQQQQQAAQPSVAPASLGLGLPPHHRPAQLPGAQAQQQQQQQQQQQPEQGQGQPAPATAFGAAAAGDPAGGLQGGGGVKDEGSPRAVLMQEQSSHDSDQQPLPTAAAAQQQQQQQQQRP